MIVELRRRIKSRSVLFSGYRRLRREWQQWLNLQIAYGLFPVAAAAAFHLAVAYVPEWVFFPLLGIAIVWMPLVLWDAWSAAHRADQRRMDFLKSKGVECDLLSLMHSKSAWAASLKSETMRDVLKGPSLLEKDHR